jgi:hypothetical protein
MKIDPKKMPKIKYDIDFTKEPFKSKVSKYNPDESKMYIQFFCDVFGLPDESGKWNLKGDAIKHALDMDTNFVMHGMMALRGEFE